MTDPIYRTYAPGQDGAPVRPENPEIIFYRSTRSYRHPRTFVGAVFCSLVGGYLAWAAIIQSSKWQGSEFFLMICLGSLIAATGSTIRKMILNVQEPVEISSAGILVKKAFYSWNQVVELGSMDISFRMGRWLSAEVRGPQEQFPTGIMLQGDAQLSAGEVEAVLQDVRVYLAQHFPHVSVGVKSPQGGFPVELAKPRIL